MPVPIQNPYLSSDEVQTSSTDGGTVGSRTRVGQIISAALGLGILMTTGVMLSVAFGSPSEDSFATQEFVLLLVGMMVCVGSLTVATVAGLALRRRAIKTYAATLGDQAPKIETGTPATGALGTLLGQLQVRQIVGQAVLEGSAMINAMLMMVDGNLLHIAPIAVALISVLLMTPTIPKTQAVIDSAFLARFG